MSVFEDPLALCEQQTIQMEKEREVIITEEEQLNVERQQIVHAITIAQHKVQSLDDSIVRKRVSIQAFDKAINGLANAFDQILFTTDQLLHIANTLEFDEGGVSDSDDEDPGQKREPQVIR
ncbi:hypothetical protein TrRE_jg5213 [Triparma retinervis]|uniref:Uncharacterized protein n=1 Tax=Triparma retinervis TaxID=2557542 RepID=A0A9W7L5H3_9STRA|nr:hypothetical protein TrRE_jg5213 [Triparma retinervis]